MSKTVTDVAIVAGTIALGLLCYDAVKTAVGALVGAVEEKKPEDTAPQA